MRSNYWLYPESSSPPPSSFLVIPDVIQQHHTPQLIRPKPPAPRTPDRTQLPEPVPTDPTPIDPELFNSRMEDPYKWRERQTVAGPRGQSKANRTVYPKFQSDTSMLFTLLDAFELNSWDSTQSTAAASNASVRVNAASSGKGKGKGGGNGNGNGKTKIKKYGQFAWIPGLAVPYETGKYPVAFEGTPQVDVTDLPGQMRWDNRYVKYPLQRNEDREPLFFGDTKLEDIGWDAPISRPVPGPRFQPTPWRWRNVADVLIEEITLDKWENRWGVPARLPPGILYTRDISPDTAIGDENITLDKYERQHEIPRRVPQSIASFIWWTLDVPDPEEQITLDKWHSRWPDPVRLPHQLRLRMGELGPEPIPDEDLLPKRIPWDSPLAYQFHVNRITLPPVETFLNLETVEEVFVDKWATPLTRINPWRPTMQRFPFRLVTEDQDPEDITLDKWYSRLSYNFRTRPPKPPEPIEWRTDEGENEEITLDKWYSESIARPWPFYALRCVKGPDGQRSDKLVITAPWLDFGDASPFPIPDIPGVTGVWWQRALEFPARNYREIAERRQQPWYDELPEVVPEGEREEEAAGLIECERPRRRTSRRTNTC